MLSTEASDTVDHRPADAACVNMLGFRTDVTLSREAAGTRVMATAKALRGSELPVTDPADPVEYAMLHQLLMRLRLATKSRDATAARDALRLWRDPDAWRDGRIVVADASACVRHDVQGVPDPVYCVQAPIAPLAQQTKDELDEALASVAVAGFAPLVEVATGVVTVLGPVPPKASPVSFTLSFLPATANLQWPSDPTLLGESLVHEAAHSWLNECLSAEGVTLPLRPLLPSPWKGVPRPPLGILHAAFAFSTVVRYLSASVGWTEASSYRRQRIAAERQIIGDHREAIDAVIAMLDSERIRHLVHTQVDLALAG